MISDEINTTFIDNKYTRCYCNIISRALQESRNKTDDIYYETHHIIPKSVNPDLASHKWNLVLLTPKEHFICHLLLTKMLTGKLKHKMVYALWSMTNRASKYQRQRFSSNLYSTYKIKMQKSLSLDRKGKTFVELYGEDRANEIKAIMKLRKPRGPNTTEETEATSNRMKDRHKTNPWKRFMQTNGKLPRKECPYCSKVMDVGNYGRYHGDKCKLRKVSE